MKEGINFIASQPLKETVSSNNLAYVIYTSGSTGKPKGVMIEHRNAVAMITWAHSVFSKKELECVLASTSYTFDLSVFEMFVPLTVGGSIVIVKNALSLTETSQAFPITLINTVPSAIAALIESQAIPETVQTINLAGEALKQSLVETLYKLPHVQKVYDLYGPSEDTTYSTFALRKLGGKATIGVPIANTKAYILDSNQQLLPLGIPGELTLSGAGLARGYLNQPDLTDKKFIQTPFAEKMYKTGDLARWNSDG